MWGVIGFGACSVSYFQEGLNNEKNHLVDDLVAADRHVVASR
jgi:hypothetical protein